MLGLDDDEFGSPPPKEPTPPTTADSTWVDSPCSGHGLFAHRGCAVYSVGGGSGAADVHPAAAASGRPRRRNTRRPSRCSACGTTAAQGASGRGGRQASRPRSRCAAAVVVGVDSLLVYGGEDPRRPRRPLGDAHVLDLETMAWKVVCSQTDPSGRTRENDDGETNLGTRALSLNDRGPSPGSEHAACAWSDDRVLVFGGVDGPVGASGTCGSSTSRPGGGRT